MILQDLTASTSSHSRPKATGLGFPLLPSRFRTDSLKSSNKNGVPAFSRELAGAAAPSCTEARESPVPPTIDEENNQLHHLVENLLSHVGDYYLVKSAVPQQDVLLLLAVPWVTAFERSLHWIGGWRPTTAYYIIHIKSTIHIESRIQNMLNRGVNCTTGDLADLSADQFTALSYLQCQTIHEESALSDQLSIWQVC
ncbi:DOG1 domain-containing protein [Heracleum sosnowskyi]|uniref:DOG1 domain-containing protein n=1 Tax=Heracleum sosnowskyi TaxID=360622 RepID=A0AAD8J1D9_9APIA|nr:DOG1 domain-containing protein [Heracleum sosnowskyi]